MPNTRVPNWAEYIYGPSPDYRDRYLADKALSHDAWYSWKRACYRAVKLRDAAKKRGEQTPARARTLRSAGFKMFAPVERGRPNGSLGASSSFASNVRARHPHVVTLPQTQQNSFITRERNSKLRSHAYKTTRRFADKRRAPCKKHVARTRTPRMHRERATQSSGRASKRAPQQSSERSAQASADRCGSKPFCAAKQNSSRKRRKVIVSTSRKLAENSRSTPALRPWDGTPPWDPRRMADVCDPACYTGDF